MSEKTKVLTDEEMIKELESANVPFTMAKSDQGGFTIKMGGTTEQQIKFYILKFGMMPTDLYIAKSGNVEFKKSGRFRLAIDAGWVESRMEVLASDNKCFAMIKAKVRVDGSDNWKEDISSCTAGDNGRQGTPFKDVLATAATRALVRALQQIAPVPTGQGDLDETDADLMAHKMVQEKIGEEIEKKAKKLEAQTKSPNDYKPKPNPPTNDEPEFPEELSK